VTASAGSTLGSRAAVRALVAVPDQRAVTHTQAFCGAVVAALALTLPAGGEDALLVEAEELCAARGATVVRAPVPVTADGRLAAVSTFPAAAALAVRLGLERGLDVDSPAWTEAYYRVARRGA
jgi:hypothetical protein